MSAIRDAGSRERYWVCSMKGCGRAFNKKYNMQIHMRQHTGERPYACVDCGLNFKWRSSLTNHLRYHAVLGKEVPQGSMPARRGKRKMTNAPTAMNGEGEVEGSSEEDRAKSESTLVSPPAIPREVAPKLGLADKRTESAEQKPRCIMEVGDYAATVSVLIDSAFGNWSSTPKVEGLYDDDFAFP